VYSISRSPSQNHEKSLRYSEGVAPALSTGNIWSWFTNICSSIDLRQLECYCLIFQIGPTPLVYNWLDNHHSIHLRIKNLFDSSTCLYPAGPAARKLGESNDCQCNMDIPVLHIQAADFAGPLYGIAVRIQGNTHTHTPSTDGQRISQHRWNKYKILRESILKNICKTRN
jgi:hypothetical protein